MFVLELQSRSALAFLDQTNFDQLPQVRSQLTFTDAKHRTQFWDTGFMLLHEIKKTQTAGIGNSGKKKKQGYHGEYPC